MAENSKIEWTDATWNPLRARDKGTGKVGWHCELHSAGCTNCYAQTFNGRMLPNGGTGLPYTRSSRDRVETFVDYRTAILPLHWKRPRMVFTCSMTDLFGAWVTDEQIDQVFAVMNACHFTLPISENSKRWHTFQVLTKRADRLRDYMQSRAAEFPQGKHPIFAAGRGEKGVLRGQGSEVMNSGACLSWPPSNVWLGVSVEDQEQADKRIPLLLQTPAAVRFLSIEPLLGPIHFWTDPAYGKSHLQGIDWVIVGGESGHDARPMHPQWVRDIRDQCQAAGVPFFFKQWGQFYCEHLWGGFSFYAGSAADRMRNGDVLLCPDGHIPKHGAPEGKSYPMALMRPVGKKAAGRMLDGREWSEFPKVPANA